MEIDVSNTRAISLPLCLSLSPSSLLPSSLAASVSACRSRVAKRSKAFNAHAQNSNHITYTQRRAGNRKRAHITLAMAQQQQQQHEGVV